MVQVHKRFSDEQVVFLSQTYTQGLTRRAEVQEVLNIGKTRFFALLKDYRRDPNSLFRPFALPKPYTSPKDIFCLRERRTVNGYRRISLSGHQIQVPNVPLYEAVEVHMVPNIEKQAMDLRLWWNQELVHYLSLPMQSFSVHL